MVRRAPALVARARFQDNADEERARRCGRGGREGGGCCALPLAAAAATPVLNRPPRQAVLC